MNKQASEALRAALIGLLAGSGLYGGLRLTREIAQRLNPKKKEQKELEIVLPRSILDKQAADSSVADYLLPILAGGAGVYGGFTGASKLYDAYRKAELEKQIKNEQQKYLQLLQKIYQRQKTAEAKTTDEPAKEQATPLVDALLKGAFAKLGEALQKQALFGVDIPSEGVIDTLFNQSKNAIRSAGNTDLGRAIQAAWLLTALGGAGATYAIGRKMDAQREKAEEQTTVPTDIKLLFK